MDGNAQGPGAGIFHVGLVSPFALCLRRLSYNENSSTRNTRIERLWVEVGTQFARRWRAFFTRLGRLHRLDRKNPGHLWLLHILFLSEINDDCLEFQEEWNLHPIRGRMTSDQSPADIRFLGQTTEGIYRDDPLDGIHPDAINRYYGVEGRRLNRAANQTGAGIASDDEELDSSDDEEGPTAEEELENRVHDDLAQNIRHAPVKVAKHRSPFKDAQLQDYFIRLLEERLSQPDDLPEDYGVRADEWEEEDYPEMEIIRPGTKGKELPIILPRGEWFARAVQWTQALDLMARVLHELDEDSEAASSDDDD
ncbi:hypothetical protein C8F04DRAFT_960890 [Mycena alexandri]|uniref:Integrase core domain-containing protein n=1 Tax=Mycena alexandri TaxID=1745969 RepID=A0AAD6WXF4_9AGAR|nr:hypothetical protein C8F04DRAFT_960890 [Mycena alexandri]